MRNSIPCFLAAECPVAASFNGCLACLSVLHQVIPLIDKSNSGEEPDIPSLQSHIEDLQPVQTSPRPCIHLGSKRRCCDNLFICRETPDTNCVLSGCAPPAVRSCESCDVRFDPRWTITIIIPCHNYARFLEDCLKSIAASKVKPTKVIVVDDASDDRPETVVWRMQSAVSFDLSIVRVDFRNQGAVCRFGFNRVDTKYCLFLDADDELHPDYLSTAVQKLEADREAAAAFPYLEAFGLESGIKHQTNESPAIVRWHDIESRNWCPASTVFRSDVLRQSLAIQSDRVPGCGCNDWITIRTVLRAGPWHAVRTNLPLYYRIHHGQMHTGSQFGKYSLQANLKYEIVTIVIAFSGRWECWPRLREWIKSSSWPRRQTRLMILNSTHSDLCIEQLGLAGWSGNIQIERIDVGFPQLANQERREREDICRQVDSAVAGLYNRAIQMAFGEWLLFVEDDVIPLRSDAIEQLMQSVGPDVAAVSGTYKHRYGEMAVAFSNPTAESLPMLPLAGEAIEQVTGTGFGCLLARRSVLSRYGLSGDDAEANFYDVNIGVRLAKTGWRWLLDRSVRCDHLVSE
jgi:glycosyltransferase involved in cell wall biosynthesis